MPKDRNLIGNKYGELEVIDRAEDALYGKDNKYHRRQWLCKCSCGKFKKVKEILLLNGRTKSCGHLKREAMIKAAKTRYKDLSGKTFGTLLVEKRIEDYVNPSGGKYIRYRCKCLNCGKEKDISANNLLSGSTKTCGRCSKTSLKDLTGKVFGELTVIERLPDKVYKSGSRAPIWKCLCSCGKTVIVRGQCLRDGSRIDCGHLNCSKGESKIRTYLNEHNIEYVPEYSFKDLLSTKSSPLRFDFAIFNKNKLMCLIEYQGMQHYWSYQYGYVQREITDKMKRDYCKKHIIPLYEIKYTENIENKLKEILQANSVLSAA